MGMILTHDVADDAGALLVALVGVEAQLAHGVQQSPMHRLQPVARIGERTRHDRRERIAEIALAQCVLERLLAHFTANNRHYEAPLHNTRF